MIEGASIRKVLLIANPNAGGHRGLQEAEKARAAFEAEGVTCDIDVTKYAGHATEIARDATGQYDAILGVGGDGTLAEVLAGVVERPDAVIGAIPVGTANVVAREIGLVHSNSAHAAKTLANGRVVEVDWGRANGRPFLAVCGVNFDSFVVRRLDLARKRRRKRISMATYVKVGIIEGVRYRGPELRVTVDDEPLAGTFGSAIVANTRNYGGIMCVCPDADMRDGNLDVVARRSRSRFGVIRHLAFALIGIRDTKRAAVYARGRRVVIDSAGQAPVQVDGDYHGKTPLHIELDVAKVRLLVPENTP